MILLFPILRFRKQHKLHIILLAIITFFTVVSRGATYAQASLPARLAKSDSVMEIPDTLLVRIEQAQDAINRINTENKRGFQIEIIRQNLPEVRNNINGIKSDILAANKVPDAKTLVNYQVLLKDMQETLEGWRKTLTAYNKELQDMSDGLVALSDDSLLNRSGKDTTQKRLYGGELTSLRYQLQEAGKKTTANLDSVSKLLANVSNTLFTTNELQGTIDEKLKKSGEASFGKESPYIWAASGKTRPGDLADLLRISYLGQNRILGYFISNSWDNRILLILIGAIFFVWIYRNFKKSVKSPLKEQLASLKLNYIYPVPILSTLIVILNLAPLIEPNSPSLYIELIEFLLLIALTFFFRKHWKRKQFGFWIIIVLVYIAVALTNAILNDGLVLRLWLIILNLLSVWFGILFYRRIRKIMLLKRFVKPVSMVYIILNIFSVLFNVFGRISLSKVFSITAVIGLTQIIGLSAFVQIATEALDLQIKISSCSGGLLAKINLQRVRSTVKRGLAAIAVALWVIVFVINLNISGPLYTLLSNILSKPRTLGSISFSIGDLLVFILVVYISNLLQKYVGILFGEENATFTAKAERKSSKLVLIRLLIFIAGLLLAITAAGFALDKLTVIVGALGVGIGLGMQNIVNNFVSGIILIFEKPFQIGDFIELADKKGRVKDIGIRSSKLITQQGSEVIVPNGDLLSNRLVNWTLSNSYLKTELLLKVEGSADHDLVKKIIVEEIGKAEDAVKNMEPEILFNTLNADSVEFKIRAWIGSIYNEDLFKSTLLHAVYLRLKEKNIKML